MRNRLALILFVVATALFGTAATPAAQAADPVIAAAGDVACDPGSGGFNAGLGTTNACRQLYTSNLLVQGGYAAVLPLGDLQYEDGLLTDFLLSYDLSWGRVKQITRPVPGNHEYHTDGAAGYFDYFNGIGSTTGPAGDSNRGYYSYDIGSWHLVALNSNCGAVGGCGATSPQGQWLRDDLAASNSRCTLAYWHHPLFSSGNYRPGIASVRPLFQALYDHGADVVLSGHDHNYERFAPQDPTGAAAPRGPRQFIVGTGGKSNYGQGSPLANSEVRNSSSFGVLELTLRQTTYDWRFVPAAGDTFTDSGSEDCRNAPAGEEEHARPEAAETISVRLVPAFESCTAPNAVHGDPLAVLSCEPPVRRSAHLTVGTPDANDERANFKGYLGLSVTGEDPIDAGNGDQADVEITTELTDVRMAGDLSDYLGELQGRLLFRVTDRRSGILVDTPATAVEVPFAFTIPCTATADTELGSDCNVVTSVDTLVAGAATENGRSVWELLEAEVLDGGADGLAATPDNTDFAEPGIFGP